MLQDILGPEYAQAADELAVVAFQYAVNIGSALAVLLIGLFAAGLVQRWVKRGLADVRGLDATVRTFIARSVKYLIWAIVLVAVLAQFGVQTTSIIAALGAVGLAIGLALQGTLANIAAGIMLLVLRPFNVGDFIDANGVSGTIEEIGLFVTGLTTADGVNVTAPNNQLWNTVITNYTRNKTRRMELVVGIGYDDDIDLAFETLLDMVQGDARILKDPAPVTLVKSLDDSAVSVAVRAWIATDDFWATSFDMTKQAKEKFDKAGLSIPFPQRDVHMYQMKAKAA
jgi:small conductance mechanosensitive channel